MDRSYCTDFLLLFRQLASWILIALLFLLLLWQYLFYYALVFVHLFTVVTRYNSVLNFLLNFHLGLTRWLVFGKVVKPLFDVVDLLPALRSEVLPQIGFPSLFQLLLLPVHSPAFIDFTTMNNPILFGRTVNRYYFGLTWIFREVPSSLVTRFTLLILFRMTLLQFVVLLCLNFLKNLLHRWSDYSYNRSLVWLFLQQRQQKLLYGWSDILIPYFEWHFQYLVEDFFIVLPRIEGSPVQNLVKNDAKRPHINRIGVVMKFSLLWCNVLLGTRNGLHNDFLSTESEISQLDLGEGFPNQVFGFEQDVLRFQIPMSNSVVMQFLNSLAHLQNTFQCLFLPHLVIFA